MFNEQFGFLVLGALYFAWNVWRGMKTGKIGGRWSSAERTKEPMSFWMYMAVYTGSMLLLSGKALTVIF